jgi:hypothetical protein
MAVATEGVARCAADGVDAKLEAARIAHASAIAGAVNAAVPIFFIVKLSLKVGRKGLK